METTDRFLSTLDNALRTLSGAVHAARPMPVGAGAQAPLDKAERHLSGALMRVNHVGEVCAQALYQAQALTARSPELRLQMAQSAREETDHLAWTQQRLEELDARPSFLNPLWVLSSKPNARLSNTSPATSTACRQETSARGCWWQP